MLEGIAAECGGGGRHDSSSIAERRRKAGWEHLPAPPPSAGVNRIRFQGTVSTPSCSMGYPWRSSGRWAAPVRAATARLGTMRRMGRAGRRRSPAPQPVRDGAAGTSPRRYCLPGRHLGRASPLLDRPLTGAGNLLARGMRTGKSDHHLDEPMLAALLLILGTLGGVLAAYGRRSTAPVPVHLCTGRNRNPGRRV